MNWTPTIFGSLFIGLGCLKLFFPQIEDKWRGLLGGEPSSRSDHLLLGSTLVVCGLMFVIFGNLLSPSAN